MKFISFVYSTHFLQVYEVLLHYSGHDDHNVVTATLETLQQLLKAPPPLLVHMLTTPGSIVSSSVFAKDIAARPTPCGTSGISYMSVCLCVFVFVHLFVTHISVSLA